MPEQAGTVKQHHGQFWRHWCSNVLVNLHWLHLVHSHGHLVHSHGHLVHSHGHLVHSHGHLVHSHGHLVHSHSHSHGHVHVVLYLLK